MRNATVRQQRILSFIRDRTERGLCPSFREIMAEFGIKSPNGVVCHLTALEKKGLLERSRYGRSFKVLNKEAAHTDGEGI